jgi:hypothetical protein
MVLAVMLATVVLSAPQAPHRTGWPELLAQAGLDASFERDARGAAGSHGNP